jgi:hypothetical protein
MKIHQECNIILHDHPIKIYQFVMSYQESGVKREVVWRKTWLLLVDSVKLFYLVDPYSFFS